MHILRMLAALLLRRLMPRPVLVSQETAWCLERLAQEQREREQPWMRYRY